MELTAFMLDRYDFTQDEQFARDTLVPLADPIIAFFDQYWPKRDATGRSSSIPPSRWRPGTWTVNPMPEIAGLHFICRACWPCRRTSPPRRNVRVGRGCSDELPPLPVAEVDGVKLLRPVRDVPSRLRHFFREPRAVCRVSLPGLYGVGRPDLDMARATYDKRVNRTNFGWCQDSIQAACLGLGDEAGRQVVARGHESPSLSLSRDVVGL